MNINPANQTATALEHMIKSIPREEFYTGIVTRARVANIYDKYYPTLINKLPLNEDQAIRTLLVYSLRYVNMSVQHIDILLINGLEYITRADLDKPEVELAIMLVRENKEDYDLDTITRIVGQINNKLPMDLRERFFPRLKIAVIQKLYALLGMNVIQRAANGVTVEQFQDRLEANNTNLAENSTSNNSTSLDNNYLDDLETVLGKNTVQELQDSGYDLKDISRERIKMNINKGTYEEQLDMAVEAGNTPDMVTTDVPTQNVLFAKYLDRTPQLHMDPATKELYYFDEVSRSLIPMSDVEKIDVTGMSKRKLENTLKAYELPEKELDSLVMDADKVDIQKSSPKNNIINSRLLTPEQKAWLATTTTAAKLQADSEGSGLRWYYWVLIVIAVLVVLAVIGYFVYRRLQKSSSMGSTNAIKKGLYNNTK
jgi:hypothetical protein